MRLLTGHFHHVLLLRAALEKLLGRANPIGNLSRPSDRERVSVFLVDLGPRDAEMLWVERKKLAVISLDDGREWWISANSPREAFSRCEFLRIVRVCLNMPSLILAELRAE